jgi:hypothetical protein
MVETSKKGGGGIKEKDGEGESNKMHYKHFCNCHNVPPVQV